MLIKAMRPKSTRIWLEVMMKVANPAAVVRLESKDAFPTFWIIRCKALILLPCLTYSA